MANVLLQMMLPASNEVGYKNYPDKQINQFEEKSAEASINVFRIFDSFNWIEGMKPAIQAVRESNKIAQASTCSPGVRLDPAQKKHDLDWYATLPKEREQSGAHILGLRERAGPLERAAADHRSTT